MATSRAASQRALIAAAVLLAVAGLVLVFTGDDGDSGGSAVVTGAESPGDRTAPDGDDSTGGSTGDPQDDTGTGQPTEPSADDPVGGTSDDAAGEGPTEEPLEPTDTPTAQPTPGPRATPTLPSGMRLPEPVQVPDPATVDGDDPTAVAVAALTAAYSFDTAHDATPEDAMVRAQTWLAEAYGSSAYDLDGLRQDIERDWADWTAHQALASINAIEPHTTDVDQPDTATRAERRFYVRMTPIGRDAWNGSLKEHQWFAFLGRDSATGEWRVVELQTPLAHR